MATGTLPPASAEYDYVSPGLARIEPAACFPNRVVGNKAQCPECGFMTPIEDRFIHKV